MHFEWLNHSLVNRKSFQRVSLQYLAHFFFVFTRFQIIVILLSIFESIYRSKWHYLQNVRKTFTTFSSNSSLLPASHFIGRRRWKFMCWIENMCRLHPKSRMCLVLAISKQWNSCWTSYNDINTVGFILREFYYC